MNDAGPVLLQYGAIGAISILALAAVRVLFNKLTEALKQANDRGDRLEKELLELNKTVREQYLSTITEATRAIVDALSAVRKH